MTPNAVATDAALRRAAGFVQAHGDRLRRSAAAVLAGECPVSESIIAFETVQRDDGAFRAPEAPSVLAATLEALGILADLRALQRPLVERACAWVAGEQSDDGSWSGDDTASERDVLVTTGTAAGILARTRWVRARTLDAAGDRLAAHWSPDRVAGFDWPVLAAHAHFFANADHDLADEALQWCGRELERGYRQDRFDAVRTARVFVLCDAHALPGARIEARELVAAIRAGQAEDGGWPAPCGDSAAARAASTFDAMVALARLDPATGRPAPAAGAPW